MRYHGPPLTATLELDIVKPKYEAKHGKVFRELHHAKENITLLEGTRRANITIRSGDDIDIQPGHDPREARVITRFSLLAIAIPGIQW